ncbi:D-alanyl-D-alanine carboxypeptidase [Georgenia satyanarayanai]|uniref:D-alanyl-D-alanine carboxypeptidase n=1 Tax=Georgenia satyanarayanai TaxID=860221 RepID=A0A2Y9AN50_9MICO|nr:M15 family metallopeptidase [Georgenia satyanarayanai]PYF97815.1 D-alanyl-D-alanine carboxypeptidase-like protein [Georgenia satyanarayanai]SSA45555.1 D-alanyl-D-alanine carboxypeptidase [Georgenia satyanarayanai]
MDGILAISQRMAQIEVTLGSISVPRVQPAAGAATAFSEVLARAVADTAPTVASTSTGGVSFELNSDGVPVDLAAYGNGRIPRDALEPVGETGHRLWAPAAQSFEKLLSAAAADGVSIGVTDSYRSYDVQVDVVRRKGLYSEGGLGAKPGTSQHGWGMAVDLDLDPSAQAWMRANAARFGFVEDTPREPWHWAFQPS